MMSSLWEFLTGPRYRPFGGHWKVAFKGAEKVKFVHWEWCFFSCKSDVFVIWCDLMLFDVIWYYLMLFDVFLLCICTVASRDTIFLGTCKALAMKAMQICKETSAHLCTRSISSISFTSHAVKNCFWAQRSPAKPGSTGLPETSCTEGHSLTYYLLSASVTRVPFFVGRYFTGGWRTSKLACGLRSQAELATADGPYDYEFCNSSRFIEQHASMQRMDMYPRI